MNILLLRGFNNYFNRTVKKYSDLQDYRDNSSSYLDLANINFNPNDGVSTILVIGSTDQKENNLPLDWENIGTPDYCICYESVEGNFVIRSRWFILESERTRNGQYRIALKRDVIAEHFNKILEAPCFVNKGFVNDIDNPLLYNSESMSVNRIKRKELLLKDETRSGWIVGYTSQDGKRYPADPDEYYELEARTGDSSVAIDYNDLPYDLQLILNDDYYTYTDDDRFQAIMEICDQSTTGDRYVSTLYRERTNGSIRYDQRTPSTGWTYGMRFSTVVINGDWKYSYGNWTLKKASGLAEFFRFCKTYEPLIEQYNLQQAFPRATLPISTARYNELKRQYQDAYVVRNGRGYFIDFGETQVETDDDNWYYLNCIDWTNNTALDNQYLAKVGRGLVRNSWDPTLDPSAFTNYRVKYQGVSDVYGAFDAYATNIGSFFPTGSNYSKVMGWRRLSYTKLSPRLIGRASTKIKTYISATRQQCTDANYDIFAIPFSDDFKFTYAGTDYHINKEMAMQIATCLGMAGDNVYDIQLLPYFPDRTCILNRWVSIAGFNLTPYTEDVDYSIINAIDDQFNEEVVGFIFWSRTSTGTFNIVNDRIGAPMLALEDLDDNLALNRKLNNEAVLLRLVSPNYAGQFEFSNAKGAELVSFLDITAIYGIEYFNVDFTYKPYNPYIHVVPSLKGLYGDNFVTLDDSRGLICGGDFSMSRVTSAWEQYQLNNKNYQEIFDRQIKNMDVNNAIVREQTEYQHNFNIGIEAAGLGMGANIAGSMPPGWWQAIGVGVGQIAGGISAGVAKEKDMEWLARQQAENKSYAKDMYGYNLGNIQALPNALAKTGAWTANNKIFPFVETYICTEVELEALKEKIKYNGMTIMVTDKLSDFVESPFDRTFVSGQLIRLEGLDDDFHIADAIYAEVAKGFYVPQGE